MDPKKHRMWLRYHLGLKMDRECIRKVEPEIYSDMLRPRLSQCCDKSQDILTDILFEEHHRIVELYRDMNIDLTRSLSRDEKGAQMRKGNKFGDMRYLHELACVQEEMPVYRLFLGGGAGLQNHCRW